MTYYKNFDDSSSLGNVMGFVAWGMGFVNIAASGGLGVIINLLIHLYSKHLQYRE